MPLMMKNQRATRVAMPGHLLSLSMPNTWLFTLEKYVKLLQFNRYNTAAQKNKITAMHGVKSLLLVINEENDPSGRSQPTLRKSCSEKVVR